MPLELSAAESGLLVAENTGNLAVVDREAVLYQSDRVLSGRHFEQDGKIWFLEGEPNRHRVESCQLVAVDGQGQLERIPLPGQAHRLVGNGQSRFVTVESGQGGAVRMRWVEPGKQAGPLFELEGNTLEEIHIGEEGELFVLTDDFRKGGQWVYRLAYGQPAELLHHEPGARWMTVAPTDQGVLAFGAEGVVNASSGERYQDLTGLVEEAGIPWVTGRQHEHSTRVKPRPDDIVSVFQHVIDHSHQANPLLRDTPAGLAVQTSGSVRLAAAGADLPKVVEEMVSSTDKLRQKLRGKLPQEGAVVAKDGWQFRSDGQSVEVSGPGESRAPIIGGSGSFVTALEAFSVDEETRVAVGFSDGAVAWCGPRLTDPEHRLQLEASVSGMAEYRDGVLFGTADGSLHFLESGPAEAEPTAEPTGPQVDLDFDTIQIGDFTIDIER